MIKDVEINVSPDQAADDVQLRPLIARRAGVREKDLSCYRILRRSIDSRRKDVKINLSVRIATFPDKELPDDYMEISFQNVADAGRQIVIVGAGPAGLFAALKALELGIKPIVLERGKDVDSRRLDITGISRSGIVDPDSNYCFGEGGAGTFSDGKLFTRSKKRGNVREVLNLLVQHGASRSILTDAHPHIGSDKLPKVIKAIRETIVNNGGEVRFSTKADHLDIKDNRVRGVVTSSGESIPGAVILVTGHSARDTIRSLHSDGVRMESKGFAMGVRLEHPQELIDRIQYHSQQGRGEYLPAAEYNFVTQADGRGVYSFCMCPGGVIVPASSAPGELVVNGMSASARAGAKANSGMVVEIRPGDFPDYGKEYPEFELLELQEELEKTFFRESGNSLNAPAQRMKDFTEGHLSETLPSTSYAPGIHTADFTKLFPPFISRRLQAGFREFGKKSKGFLTNDAVLIGLESRTSSPVRIPRDRETLEHVEIADLYPAGEGAGYAGGIVSAAIDGMRCVEKYAQKKVEEDKAASQTNCIKELDPVPQNLLNTEDTGLR